MKIRIPFIAYLFLSSLFLGGCGGQGMVPQAHSPPSSGEPPTLEELNPGGSGKKEETPGIPLPTTTPPPEVNPCIDGNLEVLLRNGYRGVRGIFAPPGRVFNFCAQVPQGTVRLHFEAADASNRTCASARLTVRQTTGEQWTIVSGPTGSPSVRASAITDRSSLADPSLRLLNRTSPGLYIVTLEGLGNLPGCQTFNLSYYAEVW